LGAQEEDHEDGEQEVFDVERGDVAEEEPVDRSCCCNQEKGGAAGVGTQGEAGGAQSGDDEAEQERGPGEAVGSGDQKEGADDEDVDGEFLDARERI
jgi:hypothetical protein